MMTRNILEVIDSSALGGAAKATMLQSRAFAKLGFGVTIVFPPGPYAPEFRALQDHGIRPIEYPVKQKNILKSVRFLRKIIRKNRIEVIHSHHYVADFVSLLSRVGMTGVRQVISIHEMWKFERFPSLLARIRVSLCSLLAMHCAHRIFALSTVVQRTVRESYRLPEGRVVVTLNGIDFEELAVDNRGVGKIRDEFAIGRDDFVILCVGALVEHKGQRYMIEAMGEFLRDTRYKCFLLGNDLGGRDGYRRMIRDMALQDRIYLPGFRRNIADWLATADVYVHPALYDTLPRALLEAMYMKLPVVVSDIETLLAVVEHDLNGIVTRAESSKEIAEAIAHLKRNRDLARRLGEKAHQFVAENCSIDAMVGAMASHL